jgi:hypothetical protein
MAPVVQAIMLCALVSSVLFFAYPSHANGAEGTPLSIGVDHSLTLVGQPVGLTIAGQAAQSLDGTNLVVTIKGPVDAAEIGSAQTDSAVVAEIARWLGTVPASAGSAAETTTTIPPGFSTTAELAAGTLKASIVIPAGSPATPGAYLILAEVRAGGTVLASGESWMGKASVRQTPLDVAFVLPVSLGIHKDCWTGAFVDHVLEQATVPVEAETANVRGLLPIVDRFPAWNLSVVLEPFLLAQLRDMADGYIYKGADGGQVEVGENDLAAQNASITLAEFADLATRDSVEILASPYTGADLGLLAAEGWRDGFEQIQMGKQELQRTLDLDAPVAGAYSPDLGLTSDSLTDYAAASIEYLVVDAALKAFLEQQYDAGAVTARAQDTGGDRLTLVFAERAISAVMHPPWDVGLFGAALAAELARGAPDALVMAPADLFELMPTSYLEEVGRVLTDQAWIRTCTLRELVRLYSPGSQPVLFVTSPAKPDGYIENTVMAAVRNAHAAVMDLGMAADTTLTPVDLAHRLLYTAESRWWSRSGTSPQEASMGLAYAAQARTVAEAEFSKVRLAKVASSLTTGAEGALELTIENDTGYSMSVELRLSGDGIESPNGEQIPLDLPPGRTELSIRVASEGGSHSVAVSLMAGSSVLDERTHVVRFLGLMTVLPWVIAAAVLLVGGAVYFVVRRRRRSRHQSTPG